MARKIPAGVSKRAKKIRLLLMDVDGVMTRGDVYLQSQADGTALELKVFSAHDGAGLKLARIMGLRTGVITGRESAAMTRRARELDMEFVYQDAGEKMPAYQEIVERAGLREEAIAYVGDDLPDLAVFGRVGLAMAVANAAPEVKRTAHYVTRARGGEGAVREVVELILKAQGRWEEAVKKARA